MTNNFADEFDVGQEAPPPSDKLEQLRRYIAEALSLKARAAQLEDDAKACRGQLYELVGHPSIPKAARIPDLMAELQVPEIAHGGFRVKIKDEVSGSLPKDDAKRKKAIQLIEQYEASGVIQTQLAIKFARSQHNEAHALAAELEAKGYTVELTSDVHANTLKALVRDRLKSGEDVDHEALGCNVGKIAEIKEAKK